jgi:diguanylate cyclase (GGDEF)-like protein
MALKLQKSGPSAALPGPAAGADVAAGDRRRARWESIVVSTIMLIVVAAGILGLWLRSRTSAYEGFRERLVQLAAMAATTLDPALHAQIRRPEQLNDPDYVRAVAPLRRLRASVPTIHYIYTIVQEHGEIHFVLDAADPGARTPSGKADQSGVWEIYPHHTATLLRALGSERTPGVATASTRIATDEWGQFMSGLAPIRDARGRQIGAVGLDMDASLFAARLADYRMRALLGLVPAGLLISIFGVLFYRVRCRGLADARAAADAAVAAQKAATALVKAAQEDRLTGLSNRTVFMEQLDAALARVRNGQQADWAVLFFDFDRFKLVNDTLGHDAGDELLRQIAQRLRTTLRVGDSGTASPSSNLISRFGGDEFLILLNDLRASTDAVIVAERLLNALTPAYNILGHEIHSTASVGVVTSAHCGGNAEEAIRNADVAMYEAKRAGRGCSVVFSEAMHARMTRHLAIETSLRRAIGTTELSVAFEPIIELQTGHRCGVAAVLQWQHPTLGNIPPGEFLPIANECGLAQALAQWMLEQCCRCMAAWREMDLEHAPQIVSISVSRFVMAIGERLAQVIANALQSASVPAHCLQIELSEPDVVSAGGTLRRCVDELHQQGVNLVLRDFGTGHGSLSILREYPFGTIKMTRSLLPEMRNGHEGLAVVGACLSLIRNLGKQSIADGVEDEVQVAVLKSLGCELAQGPLFAECGQYGSLGEVTQGDYDKTS